RPLSPAADTVETRGACRPWQAPCHHTPIRTRRRPASSKTRQLPSLYSVRRPPPGALTLNASATTSKRETCPLEASCTPPTLPSARTLTDHCPDDSVPPADQVGGVVAAASTWLSIGRNIQK